MTGINRIVKAIRNAGLIKQIMAGILIGASLGFGLPSFAISTGLLGQLFVAALKAVAPILVFALVTSAIANQKKGEHTHMKPIIGLYVLGTVAASFTAVIMSFLFPIQLTFTTDVAEGLTSAPAGMGQVFQTLLFNIVDNPIHALMTANFIGILAWSIVLGLSLRHASDSTKRALLDFSGAITRLVQFVIHFAPLGILGLVAQTIAETGFSALAGYSRLIGVLLSCMLIVALILNPLIVFVKIRRNPYPLVFKCLRQSGINAFFTRSSAANVPVNMDLCKELGLHEDTYSVSIPLGATINMAGAAITITVLSLAAAHTQQIEMQWPTAILLSLVASVSACGASGVAGGSLMLIPLACGLFGLNNDIAMQVIAIGFMISVIQDSAETALNSSTDVLFTAAADPAFAARSTKK